MSPTGSVAQEGQGQSLSPRCSKACKGTPIHAFVCVVLYSSNIQAAAEHLLSTRHQGHSREPAGPRAHWTMRMVWMAFSSAADECVSGSPSTGAKF